MVELTIDDLLRWKAAQMSLAGAHDQQHPALDAEFSWAVCIRSTVPVFPPLRGQELVIVPSIALDELARLESIHWQEVAENLRALQLSGVITDHPGLAAGLDDLVVIEVSPTSVAELEVRLNREFTERRGNLYQLGSDLARTFSSASIGGLDLNSFLDLASRRTGIPVALVAATGRVLAASEDALAVPVELARPEQLGRRVSGAGADWISQPVRGAGLPDGVFLAATLPVDEPGDRARLLLDQAGEALGLMFDRLPPVEEISPGHEAREILIALAQSGTLPPAAARRLVQISRSVDLTAALRLLISLDDQLESHNRLTFRFAGTEIEVVDERLFREHAANPSTRYVVSPPFLGIERLPDVVEAVVSARRLVELGHIEGQRLDLAAPGDAGVLSFLLAAGIGHREWFAQGAAYAEAQLGALAVHEQARGMQLVETLGVYLDSGASIAVAAGKLGIHRNTLAYRIARIEELTSSDLSHPPTRFDLQLAFAFHRIAAVRQDTAARMQR